MVSVPGSFPNIKWTKDRGNEPQRPKEEYPWFWNGGTFKGDRVNDVHLTNQEKMDARKGSIMIQKVHIQNFKSLRDVSIDLERFTVFVGANGSGKTSVLEAIHNAVRAATGDPQKVFAHERHGDWIYTRGGVGDLSIRCETDRRRVQLSKRRPPEGYPPSPELMQKETWDVPHQPCPEHRCSHAHSNRPGGWCSCG